MRTSLIWIAVLAALGLLGWMSDFVTLQGERTIYTADCRGGSWNGTSCSGVVVAGKRFRFRALQIHREVLFWTVAAPQEASGKFSDCEIIDGRNWVCKNAVLNGQTITREMAHGKPVPDQSGQATAYHQVAKWYWLLLNLTAPAQAPAQKPVP